MNAGFIGDDGFLSAFGLEGDMRPLAIFLVRLGSSEVVDILLKQSEV